MVCRSDSQPIVGCRYGCALKAVAVSSWSSNWSGSFSPPINSEMMTVRSDSQSSGSYNPFAIRSASMNSIRSSASFRSEQLVRIVFAPHQFGNDDGSFGLAVFRVVQPIRHPLGFDEQHPIERVLQIGTTGPDRFRPPSIRK